MHLILFVLLAVEVMESEEEEEEVVMATVGGVKVPLNDVTEDMVSRMSLEEKAEYIRLGQEMYQSMYEWGTGDVMGDCHS